MRKILKEEKAMGFDVIPKKNGSIDGNNYASLRLNGYGSNVLEELPLVTFTDTTHSQESPLLTKALWTLNLATQKMSEKSTTRTPPLPSKTPKGSGRAEPCRATYKINARPTEQIFLKFL